MKKYEIIQLLYEQLSLSSTTDQKFGIIMFNVMF